MVGEPVVRGERFSALKGIQESGVRIQKKILNCRAARTQRLSHPVLSKSGCKRTTFINLPPPLVQP